jgi:uncharacterized protein YndB with AHSA1/START domain
VKASPERAFRIFTEDMDSWWPRTHHIGKVPMKAVRVEGRPGGRCYTEQTDGSECDWGRITVWEPPHRFVMAWLINAEWQYQPDASKASEVEVRFTPQADGGTRVDLEHRGFERMGASGSNMRMMVGSAGGWGTLLELFAARAGEESRQ